MFPEGLSKIITCLDEARAQGLLQDYALIGGLAVSIWGEPRATRDLDFAVAIGSGSPQSLAAFLEGSYRPSEPDDPLRGVVSAFVQVGREPIPVQLVFLPEEFSEMVFDGVERVPLMGCAVPVVAWDKLVLLKLYAGGPQDLLDAKQIVEARCPSREVLATVAALAGKVGLAEEWARLVRRAQMM